VRELTALENHRTWSDAVLKWREMRRRLQRLPPDEVTMHSSHPEVPRASMGELIRRLALAAVPAWPLACTDAAVGDPLPL
jgi:hypothetical protein